jgi:xanthine dehydrogenase accessory factor
MVKGPDTIPETALDWHRAGRGAVLATVMQSWGSAPRRAGAQMVVDGQGRMMGSVSGGCVEGDVVLEAQSALATGAPACLTYGVTDDTAFAAGLACGGTIRVLLEPVTPQSLPLLERLVQARAAKRAVGVLTDLTDLSARMIAEDDPLHAAQFRTGQSGMTESGAFLALHLPPLRLIIVGAVHIAQVLAPMARLAGYGVQVVDPRTAFATQARFPGTELIADWPDTALEGLALDSRCAVVTLCHEPRLDDAALQVALRSRAFYIGSLGSMRSHAARLERLRAQGFTDADLARLHGPLGLPIGAQNPAEIALSALAQITAVLRGT